MINASQECLFDFPPSAPKTEGIKYAGSKLKMLPSILNVVSDLNVDSIFDGFSGSTRVSQMFAQLGYRVTSSDLSVWSKCFGECYLQNSLEDTNFHKIIEHLNNVEPINGWFTEHYGGSGNTKFSDEFDGLKKPWQKHNTQKLDAIRAEIDKLGLTNLEKSVALTSLVLALDKVDNTLGHFTSYLKAWSPRSYKNLHLRVPSLFRPNPENKVLSGDIFENLKHNDAQLTYLDPPYGSNNEKMPPSRVRYTSYYHLWETIILNDKPELFGKAKRRVDSSDKVRSSVFEDFRKDELGSFICLNAISTMLKQVNSQWTLLSYSSGGRATAESLIDAINSVGKLKQFLKVDYKKNVMSKMTWTDEWASNDTAKHYEFLFLIENSI